MTVQLSVAYQISYNFNTEEDDQYGVPAGVR